MKSVMTYQDKFSVIFERLDRNTGVQRVARVQDERVERIVTGVAISNSHCSFKDIRE